jgi:signal transduction histidine kinase
MGLARVSRLLESMMDLPELLERIMEEAKLLTEAEASSLMLWDDQREELFFEVALGQGGEAVKPIRLKLGEGVAGSAALSRSPVNVPDVTQDERWFAQADAVTGFATRSMLAVPMLHRGRLVGVLEVLNRRGSGSFTSVDEANLSVLAGEAAILVENTRLHEEKVQAERLAAVGRAVSELAHCMKNILNGVQGGAYVLELGLAKDNRTKLQTGWDMVKRNTTFLSNLVLDMLAYAKQREPHYEDTDVNGLVETVAELLAAEAAQRGVEVKVQADPEIQSVRVDPTGIYRVLLNLGTNAVDACGKDTRPALTPRSPSPIGRGKGEGAGRPPEGGHPRCPGGVGEKLPRPPGGHPVGVTGREAAARGAEPPWGGPPADGRVWLRSQRAERGWFKLEVEDNGCGIAPENRASLFTAFFSTKGAKGTGLGLPVAAKIAKEHGGWIDVNSEVGKGTCFTVWLPVAGRSSGEAPRSPAGESASRRIA